MSEAPRPPHREVYETSALAQEYMTATRGVRLWEWEREILGRYFTDRAAPLLDGGCGGGRTSLALEALGHSNITAFDFSHALIEDARQTAAQRGSRVTFLEADACELGRFPAGSFQYIYYGSQLLSLIPMPGRVRALHEVRRLLRPGGVFVLSALNRRQHWRRRALLRLFALRNRLLGKNCDPAQLPYLRMGGKLNWRAWLSDGPLATWFVEAEVRALVEAADLPVLMGTAAARPGSSRPGLAIYLACVRGEA